MITMTLGTLFVSFVIILSVLGLRFITRALLSLFKLYNRGIDILPIGYETIKSIFEKNSKKLFESLFKDFKNNSQNINKGIYGWLTPVGKPFVVISDSNVLSQIIVENQSKLTKHHAFGLLEVFRKTDLKSGLPAWKVVHRIASKFPIHDKNLQSVLANIFMKFCDNIDTTSIMDFAEYTKESYWIIVLVLVIGEAAISDSEQIRELRDLYKEAWLTCIETLGQPLAHMFKYYLQLPLPLVTRYKNLSNKLREKMLHFIKRNDMFKSEWSVLSVIKNEMSEEDQLEVVMEFLFTGISSVTSTFVWLLHNLSLNIDLQMTIRKEMDELLLSNKDALSLSSDWVSADHLSQCSSLDASLRETLRLFSPIHIGRLSVEEFTVINTIGEKIKIPKGTDIMSNMWFIQRDEANFSDPNTFDHTRFIDKPHNIPHYHPFSMGVRSCPGQRIAYSLIKLITANLIYKYDISSYSNAEDKLFESNLMLPVTPCNIFLKFTHFRK